MSERSVQRAAERGDKISDSAIQLIAGTDLDSGIYLDKLKRVPKDLARDCEAR